MMQTKALQHPSLATTPTRGLRRRIVLGVLMSTVLVACGGGGGAPASVANANATASTGTGTMDSTLASATSNSSGFKQTTIDVSTKSAGISQCADVGDVNGFSAVTGFSFDNSTQAKSLEDLLNHARCLAGVPALKRDARLDGAAYNHANYSILNGTATHTEQSNHLGFTSSNPGERMVLTNYPQLSPQKAEPYQWGEVLSKTGPIAREAYDGLMSAIYHRLAMLSPQVTEAGVGLKTNASNKEMVSVIDMAATSSHKHAGLIVFPAPLQQQVPTSFNSDLELPDPFPTQGIVGYPVSVQSDRGSVLSIVKFELTDSTGKLIPAFIRANQENASAGVQADTHLEGNEAFLSATTALAADTVFTAKFEGTLNGVPVSKTWTFRTAAAEPLAQAESNTVAQNAFTRIKLAGCTSAYNWRFTNGLEVTVYSNSWMQVKALTKGMQWAEVTDSCGKTQRIDFQVL
jgi:uncharacterized protein YkwD